MPNWACGLVSVSGTKRNVINFVSRFIYDGDKEETEDPKLRYFARSFTNTERQSVLDDIEDAFNGQSEESEFTFEIQVDFAWSAFSCTIQGYPQDLPDECITLMDACKADHVCADIKTEEGGMCFEEHITCDKLGQVTSECMELQSYKCPGCGYITGLASFNDADEYSCPECGDVGLEAVGSEEIANG